MAQVNQWCQKQPYRMKESPAVDLTALPAGVEEIPETDDLQINNLNAARMARQPLQSRGWGGGTPG